MGLLPPPAFVALQIVVSFVTDCACFVCGVCACVREDAVELGVLCYSSRESVIKAFQQLARLKLYCVGVFWVENMARISDGET